MSKLLVLGLALSGLVSPVVAMAAPKAGAAAKAEKANWLTPAEKKAGWKLLFDGKTTNGWRGYNKQEVPSAWKVVDGALVFEKAPDAKGGDIITVDKFKDFELQIDWRISEKGNSGIMYRVAEQEGKPPYVTGPEYQVLDDERHPDSKAGKNGDHKAGALYDVYPPAENVVKPANEWNSTKIVVNGTKIEHWLNGKKVVEADVGSEDWNKRIAASKWSKAETFAKMPEGHIDLQDHGDKVEFRNIKIRTLGAAPTKAAAPGKAKPEAAAAAAAPATK